MLLTGPNASGKTVYLRTVALIVYLAHVLPTAHTVPDRPRHSCPILTARSALCACVCVCVAQVRAVLRAPDPLRARHRRGGATTPRLQPTTEEAHTARLQLQPTTTPSACADLQPERLCADGRVGQLLEKEQSR